jgi:hypothetical protein
MQKLKKKNLWDFFKKKNGKVRMLLVEIFLIINGFCKEQTQKLTNLSQISLCISLFILSLQK